MANLGDLFADPQLRASGFFKRASHPSEGEIQFTELPVRFDGASLTADRLQPRLGEHSFEVLREAGFSEAEIDMLTASGATVGSGNAEAAE